MKLSMPMCETASVLQGNDLQYHFHGLSVFLHMQLLSFAAKCTLKLCASSAADAHGILSQGECSRIAGPYQVYNRQFQISKTAPYTFVLSTHTNFPAHRLPAGHDYVSVRNKIPVDATSLGVDLVVTLLKVQQKTIWYKEGAQDTFMSKSKAEN